MHWTHTHISKYIEVLLTPVVSNHPTEVEAEACNKGMEVLVVVVEVLARGAMQEDGVQLNKAALEGGDKAPTQVDGANNKARITMVITIIALEEAEAYSSNKG